MKYITFYTTKLGRFGYKTTTTKFAAGAEIIDFNEGTQLVIESFAVKDDTYTLASKLLKMSKHNADRFAALLKLNRTLFA